MRRFRWIVIASLIAGYASVLPVLKQDALYFTFLTAVAIIACWAILAHLTGRYAHEIGAWAMLAIFVPGYFIKFFLLVIACHEGLSFVDPTSRMQILFSDIPTLMRTYEIMTIAFCGLSLGTCVVMRKLRQHRESPYAGTSPLAPSLRRGRPQRTSPNLLVFALLLIPAVGLLDYLIFTLDILVAGSVGNSDGAPLPFRLAGILNYLATVLVPMVFLTVIYWADELGDLMATHVGLAGFFLSSLTLSLLTTSKAPLLLALTSTAVLWWLRGHLYPARRYFLLSAAVAAVAVMSLLGESRGLRTAGYTSAWQGVTESFTSGQVVTTTGEAQGGLDTLPGRIAEMSVGLLLRINGADSLAAIVAHEPSLDWNRIWHIVVEEPRPLNTLYMEEVLRLSNVKGTAFSISLLGFFYYIFGSALWVGAGVLACAYICNTTVVRLAASRLWAKPVMLASLFNLILFMMSEGSLDNIVMFLLFATAAVVCEGGSRYLVGSRVARRLLAPEPLSRAEASSLFAKSRRTGCIHGF